MRAPYDGASTVKEIIPSDKKKSKRFFVLLREQVTEMDTYLRNIN